MPPPFLLRHTRDTHQLMETLEIFYQADLYLPTLAADQGGLLGHYMRVHNEGETTLDALWWFEDQGRPVAVAALDQGFEDVVHVYVQPAYRRRGLGQQLLQAAQTYAVGVGRQIVGNHTTEGRAFFEAAGVPAAGDSHPPVERVQLLAPASMRGPRRLGR